MGLANWLINIGIRAEAGAIAHATRQGRLPLQWPTGVVDSLIHRLPRDPRERASIFSVNQAIIVNPDEIALVIKDGMGSDGLSPGHYMFEKTRVVGSLDVIWFKTGLRQVKWGLGNVCSLDGIEVAASGVAHVRLGDPRRFNSEIVQGTTFLPPVDLQRLLMPRFQGVLRTAIASCPAAELQLQRERFDQRVGEALTAALLDIGLELVDIEVVELSLPREFKTALARTTLGRLDGAAELQAAQTRAQVAQLDAQAAHAGEFVRAELMVHMQQRGLDPVQLAMLDSLRSLAERPDVPFSGGPARAEAIGRVAEQVLSRPSSASLNQAQAPAPRALPPGADERSAIEGQIDKLIERLANGEISEALFEQLRARLEAKLGNC